MGIEVGKGRFFLGDLSKCVDPSLFRADPPRCVPSCHAFVCDVCVTNVLSSVTKEFNTSSAVFFFPTAGCN